MEKDPKPLSLTITPWNVTSASNGIVTLNSTGASLYCPVADSPQTRGPGCVGAGVGELDGEIDGVSVGSFVGESVGGCDGAFVGASDSQSMVTLKLPNTPGAAKMVNSMSVNLSTSKMVTIPSWSSSKATS